MRRKAENRRTSTAKRNNNEPKKARKVQSLNVSEFDEFIDEKLKSGKDVEEQSSENPVIHVY